MDPQMGVSLRTSLGSAFPKPLCDLTQDTRAYTLVIVMLGIGEGGP